MLLNINLSNERINYQRHIERIIFKHLLIEKGIVNEQKDYLLEKNLNRTFIEYILNTNSENYNLHIDKYNLGYYYTELARNFNRIALKRSISRNELWKVVKQNILFKKYNRTELRIYKYILRGEIIPSPKFVYNKLKDNDDLPSYLCLVYLDEQISPELKEIYEKIHI